MFERPWKAKNRCVRCSFLLECVSSAGMRCWHATCACLLACGVCLRGAVRGGPRRAHRGRQALLVAGVGVVHRVPPGRLAVLGEAGGPCTSHVERLKGPVEFVRGVWSGADRGVEERSERGAAGMGSHVSERSSRRSGWCPATCRPTSCSRRRCRTRRARSRRCPCRSGSAALWTAAGGQTRRGFRRHEGAGRTRLLRHEALQKISIYASPAAVRPRSKTCQHGMRPPRASLKLATVETLGETHPEDRHAVLSLLVHVPEERCLVAAVGVVLRLLHRVPRDLTEHRVVILPAPRFLFLFFRTPLVSRGSRTAHPTHPPNTAMLSNGSGRCSRGERASRTTRVLPIARRRRLGAPRAGSAWSSSARCYIGRPAPHKEVVRPVALGGSQRYSGWPACGLDASRACKLRKRTAERREGVGNVGLQASAHRVLH